MSLIVKVVLARIPGTWAIERQAPMQVFTRTALLAFYDPHPEVLGQIEPFILHLFAALAEKELR
jgi:hypothetical protein